MDKFLYYYFNFDVMSRYLPDLLAGLLVTIQIALFVVVMGIPCGFALAVTRTFGIRLFNLPLIAFVDLIRSIPDLVIIVFVFFALPYIGIRFSSLGATVISLSIILAVFAEEIFWAGFTSVDRGQLEAARSTGLSRLQALRYVMVPQALRLAIPPLANQTIAITKATSLASIVAVPEILNRASSAQSEAANPSPLMLAAILFLLIFFPLVRLTRRIERRYGAWKR